MSDFNETTITELNEEIVNTEKSNGEFIRRELIRAFPSGIGRYLAYHFKPYLNEPLDTVDKYRAWIEIVDFLDNITEIKIPKIIEIGYENTSDENYYFVSGDIVKTIGDLKNKGKNIFLFGGGVVIDHFVKTDVIDEYIIGIIPTILGKGRRVFLENNPKIDLELQYYSVEEGIVVMKYLKRNN